jgi:hypothetical protein
MTDDGGVTRALPPAGWLRDPAGQTRWWDGTRWTEHVQPAPSGGVGAGGISGTGAGAGPAYGAVFGSDPRARARFVETSDRNGPATASLILIVVQLAMGAIAFVIGLSAGAAQFAMSYVWLLVLAGLLSWLVIIAAFVLGIVATVIAVRRPTPRFRAVFALVAASVLLIVAMSRVVWVIDVLGPLGQGFMSPFSTV